MSSSPQLHPSRNSNVILLILLGIFTLLFAEQLIAGWLALGDRLNISRRDLNATEIIVVAGASLWGLLSLWTALGLMRDSGRTGLRRYFDGETGMPAGGWYITIVLAVMGLVSLLIAVQIFTGWLPLGARANISRRDLNRIEWATIALTIFWGVLCLRTVLGFLRRERPAWSWGQWTLYLSIIVGLILLLSGIFDLPTVVPTGGTLFGNLAGVLEVLAPGLVVLASSLIAYRCAAAEYGDVTADKAISGTLSERARARDVRAARIPAGQTIRNRLAQSPGSGAIVGFLALFIFFSVGTDLFLEPTSLAGALTNNVTRGIVAIGTTMLMISGEFDLSVGSLLGISGLTFLGLMTGQFPPGGPVLDPVTAAILTLIFVGFLGAINGLILIRTGIPSFIVTLATLLMLRGLPLVFIAGGRNLRYVDYFSEPPYVDISRILIIIVAAVLAVSLTLVGRSLLQTRLNNFRQRQANFSTDSSDFRTLALLGSLVLLILQIVFVGAVLFVLIGSILDQINQVTAGSSFLTISFFDVMNGRITSLPVIGEIPREINLRIGVFWWFVLVVIFQFILNQTRYGNATFATGGNPGAARAQGINVNRIKITNYIIVAVLVGIAGIFDAARLQSIDALRGQGLELEVIAATVIGGALLSGGYGSIIGALLGVFMFGMMQTGLVLIGVDARLFNAFIGAIILVAVIINNWSRRIKT
jgi:ribose/xylose/arabinose/galactoside ABC-type transport system permease subunit